MRTVVLKLEETAIGEFEKLGVYRINLNRNATVDNVGYIHLSALTANVSVMTIVNAEFYQDAETTQSLGQQYIMPAGFSTLYFKVTGGNPTLKFQTHTTLICLEVREITYLAMSQAGQMDIFIRTTCIN